MNNPYISKAANINMADALKSFVNRVCIVDFGIVKKIPTRGVVQVEISVAEDARDIKIVTCVLANMASKSTSIEFVPNIGDKVMVFYPAKTHEDMFDVDKEEAILSPSCTGYNRLCGIAVLMNQFRTADHKNFIQFDGGEITLKVGYSDHNTVILTTDIEGKVHFNNDHCNVDVEANGDIKVENDNVTVEVKSDGNILVDNKNSTLTVDSEGNYTLDTMGAKSCIKNDLANLHDIIKEALHILNTTYMTITGIPCFPNQLSKQEIDIDNLMQ